MPRERRGERYSNPKDQHGRGLEMDSGAANERTAEEATAKALQLRSHTCSCKTTMSQTGKVILLNSE